MNRFYFCFFLLLTIYLHSCMSYVEKDLDMKPKLVLYCYLTPQLDTTILILTNSIPLFTSTPQKDKIISNAIVEISDDNKQWVKMEFNDKHGIYFIPKTQFPIKEGKTYYVRASAPEFDPVSSSCVVPYLRETNLNFVLQESINDNHNGEFYNWIHYHAYLEWNDYQAENNYYMFLNKKFSLLSEWNFDETVIDTSYYWLCSVLLDEYNKRCIYSDHEQDGKKISAFITSDFDFEYNFEVNHDNIYKITLLQTDNNCYLFQTSIANLDDTFFQSFMLEPFQIYSNINSGYGLFGAFVMKDYSFELPHITHH